MPLIVALIGDHAMDTAPWWVKNRARYPAAVRTTGAECGMPDRFTAWVDSMLAGTGWRAATLSGIAAHARMIWPHRRSRTVLLLRHADWSTTAGRAVSAALFDLALRVRARDAGCPVPRLLHNPPRRRRPWSQWRYRQGATVGCRRSTDERTHPQRQRRSRIGGAGPRRRCAGGDSPPRRRRSSTPWRPCGRWQPWRWPTPIRRAGVNRTCGGRRWPLRVEH